MNIVAFKRLNLKGDSVTVIISFSGAQQTVNLKLSGEIEILFDSDGSYDAKKMISIQKHDRDAHGDCMDVIRRFPEVTGIFHSYSGSAEMARELIERGWYISFSGPITYKNAKKPKEACAICPLDRILIETDAPYLPPTPYRGQMNHPCYVIKTAEEIASIKGLTTEEIANITYENAKKVYRIK